MKNFKKLVGLVLLFSFVGFNSQLLTVSAVFNNPKVNICHATGSENHPWEAIQIDNSALATHMGHGDFMYDGPTKNGKPDDKDNRDDNWCKNNAPAQISAAKIICQNESDLPNWGSGGPNITAATVGDFLANHKNCYEQPGWKYQWAPNNTANPGNNIEHAGGAWTTFDENNLPEITPGSKVWVREEIPAGYIPFSGATTNLNSTNAKNSAEFYCDTDVLNYDNYDSISNVQAGKLYHCVAFNVKIDVCPNLEGSQATVPEGYHLNNDKQCVPDTATVYVTKVVCDNEFDLPNWGNNGPDITATTATDYVASNDSCRIVPWTFEWAPDGAQNPGNNVEAGGGAWTPFSNGQVQITVGSKVWLREQLPEEYHTFSGATTDLDGTNSKRSAEFYCNTDVLNYDNYDNISPVVANAKYYCVGFNTLKPTKADGKVHVYKFVDGVQATGEMTKTEEKPDGVSFPYYKPEAPAYPNYLGPYSDAQAGDIPYESSTYNMIGGETYSIVEDLSTPLVGSSCSNENKPAYELVGYTTGKTLNEAKNATPSLSTPQVIIDGDSTIIVWNKKCVPQVIDMCKNMEGNQTEIPQGYHQDEAGNCYPDIQQCGEKTLDVVSDDSNTVDGGPATIIGSPNGAWATLSGASWIWNNLVDFAGGTSQTKTFTKSFTVVGTPVSASLEIAADNAFVGTINGNGAGVIADPTEFNYGAAKTYDVLTYITTGLNNLSFDVTNFPVENSTFDNNPAGLLYKLHVVSNDCPEEEPTTGTLIVKKVIVGSDVNPSTFTFKVGNNDPVNFDTDGQNDLTVNAGAYTVTETAYENYTTTYDNCENVNVPAGGTATCTVTNTYKQIVVDEDKPVCSDGKDNDEDGLIDINDPACHSDHNVNNPESYTPGGSSEIYESSVCSDGKDNDGDQLVDSNDPGCMSGEGGTWNPNDSDESNGGGGSNPTGSTYGGGGGGSAPKGKVLGAETSCGIYIDKFLRRGYKNDEEAVKKLQKFLNDYMKAGIKEDGKFGLTTEIALKKFQKKQFGNVLNPWGFNGPTGIFYLTTQTEVNNIMCPDLKLPIPKLTPIETNPLAPAKN